MHQSFSDYAKNKDVKAQKEWAKVQGRYKDLSFNPSIDESLVLVGDSISKDENITKDFTLFEDNSLDEVELVYEMPVTISGDTLVVGSPGYDFTDAEYPGPAPDFPAGYSLKDSGAIFIIKPASN